MALKPVDWASVPADQHVSGRVVDPQGEPVVGAQLDVEGADRGRGTQWGGIDFADPVAVTDEDGEFHLRCKEKVGALHATVEARGLAKRKAKLTLGKGNFLRLKEGVMVTGRVLLTGRPLKDVAVGMAGDNRLAGEFLGDFQTVTDGAGRFTFNNVPAEAGYYFYSKLDSLKARGAIPVQQVKTGADGTTKELGDLQVKPAYRLAGRVVLSDGKPIPAGTQLMIGRDQAWDHALMSLDENGRFDFRGLPAESLWLSVRLKGYKFSKRNPSLDWGNGGIVGRLDGDITDLTLLMEPGEWRWDREEEDAPPGVDRQPRDKPLRAAKL